MVRRGPNTSEGKAASSKNAVKHGLRSGVPVIPEVESFEEWEDFRDGVIASYQPEGRLETELAERSASLLWRLRRALNYETEMTAHELDTIPEHIGDIAPYAAAVGRPIDESNLMDKIDVLVSRRTLTSKEHMERVIRYESHLHRQWVQIHHELEAIQARRKGDRVSSLTRISVSASPA